MFDNKAGVTTPILKFNLNWEETMFYLVDAIGHSSNENALSADKSRFKIIRKWFLDKEWNERNFLGLITHLKKLGRKQGTLNKYISMGKNLDHFLNTNVTRLVKSKKEKLPEIKDVLSVDEIKQLVNVKIDYSRDNNFISSRQKVLIAFISITGCRIGEALDLTWNYIYNAPQTYVRFIDTKNGESRNSIINQELYDAIISLSRRSEYIFCSSKGKHLNSQVINHDLKRRSKKLNMKKNVHPHLFRHSLVTELSEKGTPDSDISKIVG